MLILSNCNSKGGIGKTTCTAQMAVAAAREGLKVLVADIDQQGNLTKALSPEALPKNSEGIADVLHPESNATLDDVIVPTEYEGIDLAPSPNRSALVSTEAYLQTVKMGRESRLRDALDELGDDRYDLVIIDCPPASNQLTVNAMTAADKVIIISEPELFSIEGVIQVLGDIAQIKKYTNPRLEVSGIVVNRYKKGGLEHGEGLRDLKEIASDAQLKIFEPYIPMRTAIGESIKMGEDLAHNRDESLRNVAATYTRYLKEIMKGH